MNDRERNILEDCAFGDGVEFNIEQGYLTSNDVTDPSLKALVEMAEQLYSAWQKTSRLLQDQIEWHLQ